MQFCSYNPFTLPSTLVTSLYTTHWFAVTQLSISCFLLAICAAIPFSWIFYVLPTWEGSDIPTALTSEAVWSGILLGALPLCYTAPSLLLVLSSSQVWCQSVQVDDNHLCTGMLLNLVYDVVYLGDNVWAFSVRLQLGWSSSLMGRAVQPHSVTFLKTSRIGQLIVSCLHLVTGHFQVLAGKMVDVV